MQIFKRISDTVHRISLKEKKANMKSKPTTSC